VWKFVGYIVLLALIAVGVAWYMMRPDGVQVRAPVANPSSDLSWMADLYSQNPRDAEDGTAKVKRLGANALPQIQGTLRNQSASRDQRRAALRACAILGPIAAPAIPDVAAVLSDPELTAEAAVALSFMGPQAFHPLEEALANDDPAVRRESLRSLGKLRYRAPLSSADVLPLLQDSMSDPDPSVRAVAATYLGIVHEDPEKSVPLLIEGLKDADTEVRRASATALGSFGGAAEAALPELRRATGDQDSDLAREAGRSIVRISEAKDQPPMPAPTR
jgi:HEAT repeat protein